MKLLFKQRLFSWLDSYDIYNEYGETAFTVEGKLAWGHKLEVLDPSGRHLGTVKEEVLTFLPRFALYLGEEYIGQIKKELTFFRPRFTLDCRDWQVSGDWLEWDYQVTDGQGHTVMTASKELFHWTDTYVMDIERDEDALLCLMIVLAIDAAKCSGGD
ncbi:LURP-one-related/scramblase family protein [Allofournierella massiliensis]|uniref:LURP-one-related/scramblase family protein n=1 Tax=Allofournierella massiliensis TaxID=1650663 RepID=UPI0039A0353E